MTAKEYTCLSVLGGWQTAELDRKTGTVVETFGPVFRKIQDLWLWQKDNLYKVQA